MQLRNIRTTSALLAALLLTSVAAVSTTAFAQAKKPATTTSTAGNEYVSQAQLELMVKERTAQGQPDTPEMRAALKEELINRELLLRAARAKGMDKESAVKTQMQVASDSVLIRGYLSDYVSKNPISDASLKKEYDTIKAGLGDKEYKARHILVEKKEEAEAIIKQLQAGGKFEELAKANSKDPGSKENGGDLDWAAPSNYVKPFSDAMVALEKGKFTATPVQSPFGFHIIQLTDVRDAKVPSFDEVKPQLQQRLQGGQVDSLITDLRTKAGLK